MGRVLQWSFQRVIRMVVCILLNKFDLFLVIEGNRGLGKSTMAYHVARAVNREFRRLFRFEREVVLYYYDRLHKAKGKPLEDFVQDLITLKEKRAYLFKPTKSLLYTRHEVLRFFHKWYVIGVADEMINVSFNRDFYNEEQKDLVKMINMNRDHSNLFIACVPQFQTLDSQIKNLCKVRLTVVRRGVAVIQTPNRTIYSKDKWDQSTNEKIERDWIKKGVQNPHYSKLTTFRGIVRFPPLTAKQEAIYQAIKDEKRNLVAREQMGITDEEDEKDAIDKAIELLEGGRIRNSQIIDGMAMSDGRDPEAFKRTMINRLKKDGRPHKLSQYYWENKKRYEEEQEDW